MNPGVISSRYAKALLKYVQETGNGDAVYAQVRQILDNPESSHGELEPELQKFVALLVENGRLEYVKLIFRTFMRMYDESRNRRIAHLTTAVPSPGLEERLKELLEKKLDGSLVFDTSVDPSIIGGFKLQIDDNLLDASVSRQIEELRRQLIESNNRLV